MYSSSALAAPAPRKAGLTLLSAVTADAVRA